MLPVALEPEASPECYGADRLFIGLRLRGDRNCGLEARLEALRSAGHPLLQLDLPDVGSLGAEFYRWEFATAVAGALIEIHPFDQPNVQEQGPHIRTSPAGRRGGSTTRLGQPG